MRIGFAWLHALPESVIENPFVHFPLPLCLVRCVLEKWPKLAGNIITSFKRGFGRLTDLDFS
jgi:hypothetical protein